MKVLHTQDGVSYRRWVNVPVSLFLPGAAHFFSGRRRSGVLWLLGYWLFVVAYVAFVVHPDVPYSVLDDALWYVCLLFAAALAADAARRPMKRLRASEWGACLLVWLGVLVLPASAFRTFIATPFKVPSCAMSPTILGKRMGAEGREIPGDYLVVNRLAYRFGEPLRGDVVVFTTGRIKALQQGAYYVKRIVGLPGETVRVDPPYVVADGRRITDPPVFKEIANSERGFCGYRSAWTSKDPRFCLSTPADSVRLGVREYFVLGDNGTNSYDSRYWGPVQRDAIIGKAVYIYAPAERKGMIR